MDIVPIVTKDDLSKEQIEYLQKQQTEYKLIKKVKRNPGHILFSFNVKTGEIKRASIIHNVSIGLNGLPITRAETVIEPNCYYEQALNEGTDIQSDTTDKRGTFILMLNSQKE